MDYLNFEMGFWHPFGPHRDKNSPGEIEPPEGILARKRKEIADNGWTLWSFQHRLTLESWHKALISSKPASVFVFCSTGKSSKAPTGNAADCQYYKNVCEDRWQAIPPQIRVPHAFAANRKKKSASAFIVQRIIDPATPFLPPKVQWFSNAGEWLVNKPSTRGEWLIRRGGVSPMPSVSVILELKVPYLAFLRAEGPLD